MRVTTVPFSNALDMERLPGHIQARGNQMLMPGSGGRIAGSVIANNRDFKDFFPLTAYAMTHWGVTKGAYLVACGRHAWTTAGHGTFRGRGKRLRPC